MTDVSPVPAKESLGIGSIITETFSILFGNIVPILVLYLVPGALSLLINGTLLGFDVALGTEVVTFNTSREIGIFVAAFVLQLAIGSVLGALLVQMAYDAKLSRPIQMTRYVKPALLCALPIALLSIVMFFLAGIALVALVIPALWVLSVFSVMVPAVVIERSGFGGLSRSAQLTKEYRWPIVGLFVITVIILSLFGLLTGFIGSLFHHTAGGPYLNAAVHIVKIALTSSMTYIFAALIYARLREIKEGVSVEQIVSVFD